MKLYISVILIYWIWLSLSLEAQSLAIWIDPEPGMTRFSYQAIESEVWILTADSFPELITSVKAGETVKISLSGQQILLSKQGNVIGQFSELIFWASDSASRFKIIPDNVRKTREYYDHLSVQVRKNKLRLINTTWIEHYICGVVAAEGGIYKTPEFLKVQAVCSRTYALRNLGKYAREGFDLTDKVDCQVYHGVPHQYPAVWDAVYDTRGQIAVDEFGEPIDAVFSANCGGQSANSEDVWSAPTAYLRSTESYDQYREFRNSYWTFSLSRPELLQIFSKYYKMPVSDFTIEPDYSGRIRHIRLNGDTKSVLSGPEVRTLLKLKSTKFRIYEQDNHYFFVGQGFGHGVGMCQDGAYKLSTLGWKHDEIIRHFYAGTELINLDVFLESHIPVVNTFQE